MKTVCTRLVQSGPRVGSYHKAAS